MTTLAVGAAVALAEEIAPIVLPKAWQALLEVMSSPAASNVINGLKELWAAFATFHAAGLIQLTPDQLTAMNAAGVKLATDISALDAQMGVDPATGRLLATPPVAAPPVAKPAT